MVLILPFKIHKARFTETEHLIKTYKKKIRSQKTVNLLQFHTNSGLKIYKANLGLFRHHSSDIIYSVLGVPPKLKIIKIFSSATCQEFYS